MRTESFIVETIGLQCVQRETIILFSVFGNVVKHGLSCLIYYLIIWCGITYFSYGSYHV